MKKYFMAGTDDEIQFGDMIELYATKETKGGVKHKHLECKFIPDIVDLLLEEGVIEKREVKDKEPEKKPLIDFEDKDEEDDCPCGYGELIDEMLEAQEELEKQVEDLEDRVIKLEEIVAELTANE